MLLVGTSNRVEAIPDTLKRVGRFDREFVLSLPTPEARGNILWQLLSNMKHSLSQEDVNRIGERGFGLSKADLAGVVRAAWQNAISRWKEEKASDIQSANSHFI